MRKFFLKDDASGVSPRCTVCFKAVRATERSGGAVRGACGGADGGMLAERFLGKREQALQRVKHLQMKQIKELKL
jgi:hypothetical protein